MKKLQQSDIVLMRGDWTTPSDSVTQYLQSYGRFGVPFNIVYGPEYPQGIPMPVILTSEVVMQSIDMASGETHEAKSTEEKPWSSRLKKWSKELISIVILMTLVSMALDWYRSTSMPSGEAPSLKAMTTQGLPVDIIQQSQEKPVVLYFWATWCGACKFCQPNDQLVCKRPSGAIYCPIVGYK